MEGGPGKVSAVAERLRSELAYTTVMTELAMLYRMGLANRQREGRAYRYEARMDRNELRQAMASELFTQLREDFGEYARAAETESPARGPRRKRQRRGSEK